MSNSDLQTTIDAAWEARDTISLETTGAVREAVEEALNLLDSGQARVAERQSVGQWTVNQWLKKAVLLSFRLNDMGLIKGGPGGAHWFDKVPSKFQDWDEAAFRKSGIRAVPNCVVRRGSYVSPGVVLMPSFVNIGAYVDSGTMVDGWSTVGSCAQIGKDVHLSGGAGIGGVLEPLQAGPTIIEDGCFIGARAEVAEVSSSRKARYLAWASISAPRPRSSTGPPAKSFTVAFRPIRWLSRAPCHLTKPCRMACPHPVFTAP